MNEIFIARFRKAFASSDVNRNILHLSPFALETGDKEMSVHRILFLTQGGVLKPPEAVPIRTLSKLH